MSERTEQVWFITGASSGLGRAIAEAALDAGDRVIGSARDVSALRPLAERHAGRLVTLPLDVSDRDAVFAAVGRAAAAFGRLDVVVNAAGRLLSGMIEETTEEQARAHLDSNLLGALWVSQAVIPHLREQGSGHILHVTAMGAGGGSAGYGLYGAGKSALSAISQAMSAELSAFGIKVTSLEPGPYATSLFSKAEFAARNPAYDRVRSAPGKEPLPKVSSPAKAARVVLKLVRLQEPPTRLVLGGEAFERVQRIERRRGEEYAAWEWLSREGG
ncbi:SDR family NAD(P)-dependent oxidoreductase [Streptomyces sp. Li-HN-5-11]|uniref:SDR family NAD(P)-dependent oxidoreductase n=1 Tax=Streptomyces sp. Li-HN-5-11 TaxID=3075432 RepID=UPI0028A88CE2|nr:SDR family NAD(P)-dependent oxidoreductase [Streptomyces sp. Li-HN-5-11]WNM31343.1 SDR family NAD(P)-dependent oxidoreductase [Streptomyces sp. Li-HN-5-11]